MIRELLITGTVLLACAYASRAKPATTEQRLVAAVLVAEAGGEKDHRAMAAVLEVIRNRMKDEKASYEIVVLRPDQFSCLRRVQLERQTLLEFVKEYQDHPKFSKALQMVRSRKRTDYTHGARFYHRDNILPDWAIGATPSAWLGRQKFYAELK